MESLEHGVVVFFKSKKKYGRPNAGGYGFIQPDNCPDGKDEQVFFHVENYSLPVLDSLGRIVFRGGQPQERPKIGDKIVFLRTINRHTLKPKAGLWAFEKDMP